MFLLFGIGLTSIYLYVAGETLSLFLYPYFFYCGVLISKHKKIEELVMKSFIFEICLVLFMVLVCHWRFGGNALDDGYKIIISVIAFVVIINICRKVIWNTFVSNQVVIFGQYSLCIYIEQFYLTKLFEGNMTMIEMNPFILFVIFTIMAIGIGYLCIGFAKIIEKAPILNFLMFGKHF
jgi:hypothetical protein